MRAGRNGQSVALLGAFVSILVSLISLAYMVSPYVLSGPIVNAPVPALPKSVLVTLSYR